MYLTFKLKHANTINCVKNLIVASNTLLLMEKVLHSKDYKISFNKDLNQEITEDIIKHHRVTVVGCREFGVSINVKQLQINTQDQLEQQFSNMAITNNSGGYQWYYKVYQNDANYVNRHDKVNDWFQLDDDQNEQIEYHYQDCCKKNTFGTMKPIVGDQNRIKNGFETQFNFSNHKSIQLQSLSINLRENKVQKLHWLDSDIMCLVVVEIHLHGMNKISIQEQKDNFIEELLLKIKVFQMQRAHKLFSRATKFKLLKKYTKLLNPQNHGATIVLKHYPNCISNRVLMKELEYIATNLFNTQFEVNANLIKIKGQRYYEAKQRIEKILEFAEKYNVPPTWENFSQMKDTNNLIVQSVNRNSQEWRNIEQQFKQTMQAYTVQDIQRIQNKRLWRVFTVENQDVAERNGQNTAATLMLYHGSGKTDPKLIYDGEEGFDMRFSNTGMWGQACYFAQNASYSDNGYRYEAPNQTFQMFFARVTVGQFATLGPDTTLKMPPLLPQTQSKRYDSVQGNTRGSNVYMIYANKKAYPEYLITYKNTS
ncbi:poly adp-ribose polymerase member 14-like protein [Stylonychia lemnae]|uniref:Poly [ADP-ribose] polymerase n=1 Tax=Stylonychia lemnae TaxID=5949 RepID=A0A078AAZ7_STYLE|nr:poly adp-ribose polymerase member 14-like protein [Stylonychia lemnae]|eukprot:CDW78777.1 poly adp-ribose polymerase member 14-like protein [Stylonychia lemnae]